MMRSQEIQVKSILARFEGNREEGWAYCVETANKYPELFNEYQMYAAEILRLELVASA